MQILKSKNLYKILYYSILNDILNRFKSIKFRMACKRSSVRLRYSPLDNQGFTKLRKAFFM